MDTSGVSGGLDFGRIIEKFRFWENAHYKDISLIDIALKKLF